MPLPDITVLSIGVGGALGVLGAAFALGVRHGIDWDHIAAITDITSTAAAVDGGDSRWLTSEPAVFLTDESHHVRSAGVGEGVAIARPIALVTATAHSHALGELGHRHNGTRTGPRPAIESFVRRQKPALLLGTMYALGHGSIVAVLGLLALLASQFLPDWLDPIMERIVGATLILLAVYLFYSVLQYFRGGGEFRLRSR